jgi:hypothetical protein
MLGPRSERRRLAGQPAFGHHLGQVPEVQPVRNVPADARRDDFVLVCATPKDRWGAGEVILSVALIDSDSTQVTERMIKEFQRGIQ